MTPTITRLPDTGLARAALVLATLLSMPRIGSAAEGLQCNAFLHGRDGTWRPFVDSTVVGPDGPIHLQGGEVLRPTESSAKGQIARALNDLCESR